MVPDVDLSRIDQTPVEELRAAGSVKWTAHPDALGLFVAEMDFGLAPAVAEALHAAVDGGRTG
ncbi:MAG: cysteine-S-conjugate beta-lyase, partial [Microbacteriaceae bacterium]|nr:cysteine-S-conjugate beta-lyase [Microbacteriaceae bacterium]